MSSIRYMCRLVTWWSWRKMSAARLAGQIIWVIICAVAFFWLFAYSIAYWSELTSHPLSSFLVSPFAVGVGYFLVGLPPIYLLERGRPVGSTRYWTTFAVSLVASILAVITICTPPLPAIIAEALFPMYFSIGFWVMFIAWFLWLTRAYADVRAWHRVYAWVTTIGINGALLWWLLRFSVRM